MRRGSTVGMGGEASTSTELGGGVFGCTRRASAAAFCLFACSAFEVAVLAALFRMGGGAVEILEAAGGTVGAAAGTTPGAIGSRDRAALQFIKQISTRVWARLR